MEKVLCMFCKFEVNGRCVKKNNKVKLKKKRLCKFYEDDDDKIQYITERKLNSSKPVVYLRPDWYWDRKKFKKMKKDAVETQKPSSIFTGDPNHPLTGDLSRFFNSTVGSNVDSE